MRETDGIAEVSLETARGDLLVIGGAGLAGMRSAGKPPSPEKAVQHLARAAETQALSAAFATLVTEWKKTGFEPGNRDVLLLAAKRT